MKNRRFFLLCSFLSNVLVFVMAFYAVGSSIRYHGGGEFNGTGFRTFRYFTTESNILAGIVSLLAAGFTLPVLLGKRERVPKFALVLKYVGSCAVALTFFVVLAFLGLIYGYGMMYRGASFYMHGIVPILAMVSWIVFDRGAHLKIQAFLFGLIPVVLYGVMYFVQVVLRGPARGGWEDFYAFTRGGKWWLSLMIVFAGAAVLCLLLLFLHNRCDRSGAAVQRETKRS